MTTTNLREELKQVLERKKLSQNQAAKTIPLNAGKLSAWLNNKYEGDNEKVEEAVRNFLLRNQEKAATNKKKIRFRPTSASKKFFEIARACHIDELMGAAVGFSGVGKTISGKEYLKQNPDVIYLEADGSFTAKVTMSEIHKAVGLDGRGSLHTLMVDCIDKLRDTGRLIIVDEAETLSYKSLEILRRLHDKAGIGILLVGLPRLLNNLRGHAGEYVQIYSRIGIVGKMEYFRKDDTALILEDEAPEAIHLLDEFHEVSSGDPRTLHELIRESFNLARINAMSIPVPAHVRKAIGKLGRAM